MEKTPLCPTNGVQLHASCVCLPQGGVLLMGASGSGKSDLALRFMDVDAQLVADDRVNMVVRGGKIIASAPPPLAGKLEVRGLGVLKVPYQYECVVQLAVMLAARDEVERLPEPSFFDCLGLQVPLLSLHAFDESTCAKIRIYLQHGHSLQYES